MLLIYTTIKNYNVLNVLRKLKENDHKCIVSKKVSRREVIKYSVDCTLRIRFSLTLHSVYCASRIEKFTGMNKTKGSSEIIFTKSDKCRIVFVAYNREINIKQHLIIVPKYVMSKCLLSHNCLNHCILYTFTLISLVSYLVSFVSSTR